MPRIGLLSLSNNIVGTTFGYDLFFPEQVSVVNENRIYDSSFNIDGILINETEKIKVYPSL